MRRCSRAPIFRRAKSLALTPLRVRRRSAAARISAGAGASAPASTFSTASGSTEMLHIFLSNRAGRRSLRHHRQAGARLCAALDRRGRQRWSRTGEIGELQVSGPDQLAVLLEQPRAAASPPSSGRGRKSGDKYTVDRRRLLHLLRPLRRHAQGRRRLRLAVRGRGGARHATTRCSRPRSSATPTRTS